MGYVLAVTLLSRAFEVPCVKSKAQVEDEADWAWLGRNEIKMGAGEDALHNANRANEGVKCHRNKIQSNREQCPGQQGAAAASMRKRDQPIHSIHNQQQGRAHELSAIINAIIY